MTRPEARAQGPKGGGGWFGGGGVGWLGGAHWPEGGPADGDGSTVEGAGGGTGWLGGAHWPEGGPADGGDIAVEGAGGGDDAGDGVNVTAIGILSILEYATKKAAAARAAIPAMTSPVRIRP